MAMFGRSLGKANPGEYDPSALSGADRLAMIGATLRDVGGSLRGGEGDSVAQLQQMLAGRQRAVQRQQQQADLATMIAQGSPDTSYRGMGPGADGEPLSPHAPQYQPPTMQQSLPALAAMMMSGDPSAGPLATLIHGAQPKPPPAHTPLNTRQGVADFDPATGNATMRLPFAATPEVMTPEKVLGPILAKKASGQKLTGPEEGMYQRWYSGTPSKARPKAAAAAASPDMVSPAPWLKYGRHP